MKIMFLIERIVAGSLLAILSVFDVSASTLLVSSYVTDNVLKFDASTGLYQGEFISAGNGGLNQPQGFAFGNDGNLYISSFGSKEIKRYNANTGDYVDNFASLASGSRGLAFDDSNNLYAAYSSSVTRYNAAGVIDNAFTHTFAATATGVLQGADNNIYVSWGTASSPGGIARYDIASSTWNNTWRTGVSDNSWYMAIDATGTLYLAVSDGRIYRDDGANLAAFTEAVGSSVIDRPRGLAFNSAGDLLVGSFGSISRSNILQFNGTTGNYEGVYASGGGLTTGMYMAVQPVPVPAAIWLFGSALAGLGVAGRRKL